MHITFIMLIAKFDIWYMLSFEIRITLIPQMYSSLLKNVVLFQKKAENIWLIITDDSDNWVKMSMTWGFHNL